MELFFTGKYWFVNQKWVVRKLWSPLTSVKIKTVNKPILFSSIFSRQLLWDYRPWEPISWSPPYKCLPGPLVLNMASWEFSSPRKRKVDRRATVAGHMSGHLMLWNRPIAPEVCWGFKTTAVSVVLCYGATYLTLWALYGLVNTLLTSQLLLLYEVFYFFPSSTWISCYSGIVSYS